MSPSCSQNDAARVSQRKGRVGAAQVGLLYDNANTGLAVTVIAVPILGTFSRLPSARIAVGWSLYMSIVAAARYILTRQYLGAALHSF